MAEWWINLYTTMQREAEESLPSERLLVFNVKQGWEPLVTFLELDDKSLKDTAFPHVNDKNSLLIVSLVMDIIAIGLPLWVVLTLWLVWKVLSLIQRIIFGGKRKTTKTE